jgi:luciferase family oxidoreductase group 1
MGVLDFCNVLDGMEPADVLWGTLQLAPLVESLGYSRYWLSEHHGNKVAHSSPEVLVPILAGLTQHMRIGTGGILLNLYSPFKVASDFRLLNTIFPDRIDLGLARARTHPLIEEILLGGPRSVPYEEKVKELMGYLRGTGKTGINPRGIAPPETWLLGSARASMELAADHGAAFCIAVFIASDELDIAAILAEYRDRFQPSPELPAPKWAVAVAGVCAETEKRARELAAGLEAPVTPTLVGDPFQCREMVAEMRERYATEELIFADVCLDFEDRVRSHRLLAEALGLGGRNGNGETEEP